MVMRARVGVFKLRYLINLSTTTLLSTLVAHPEPRGFKFATKSPAWLTAMQEEIDVLKTNHIWILYLDLWVQILLARSGFIESSIMLMVLSSVIRLVVAQGFTQISGTDFHHTFSPLVKATIVHIILALFGHKSWPLHQLNVKNAFLNGVLDKSIFMAQPPGFADP